MQEKTNEEIMETGSKIVRMSREIKKNYDSSIFLVQINDKDIFLLDRHGARFLHRFGQ